MVVRGGGGLEILGENGEWLKATCAGPGTLTAVGKCAEQRHKATSLSGWHRAKKTLME